jgi:hypothetical protein
MELFFDGAYEKCGKRCSCGKIPDRAGGINSDELEGKSEMSSVYSMLAESKGFKFQKDYTEELKNIVSNFFL